MAILSRSLPQTTHGCFRWFCSVRHASPTQNFDSGLRPLAQDDSKNVIFSLSAVPAGSWQCLTAIGNIYVLSRRALHHTIKIGSGKFLKGVGKLLSRSFLTKTASPQNRALILLSVLHSRFFFAGRRRKEKSIKKKRRSGEFRALRSAPRATRP